METGPSGSNLIRLHECGRYVYLLSLLIINY